MSDQTDEAELRELLAAATYDTSIPELGLGTRATNALDRANILTVEDLLTVTDAAAARGCEASATRPAGRLPRPSRSSASGWARPRGRLGRR